MRHRLITLINEPSAPLNLDAIAALVTRLPIDAQLTINESSAVKAAYQRALRTSSPTLSDLARELHQGTRPV
jgi:hypothetical protein